MTNIYDVLRRPIITEKTNYQVGQLNQYVFEVATRANKTIVKDAVETLFDVTVVKVRIINVAPKSTKNLRNRRRAIRKIGYKKAIITLEPGDAIELFEGVR